MLIMFQVISGTRDEDWVPLSNGSMVSRNPKTGTKKYSSFVGVKTVIKLQDCFSSDNEEDLSFWYKLPFLFSFVCLDQDRKTFS